MDQPGENHFAEALAKALGPTAKGPHACTQIVSLVSRLEPEAASAGFSSSNSTGPMALLLLQMMSHNSMQMPGNLRSAAWALKPLLQLLEHYRSLVIFLLCHPILWYDGSRWWRSKRPHPYLQPQGPGDSSKEWHFEH
jgi:hypothetical protein